ncbi:unnamed protein product, partial [Ilex paraguariensis]
KLKRRSRELRESETGLHHSGQLPWHRLLLLFERSRPNYHTPIAANTIPVNKQMTCSFGDR